MYYFPEPPYFIFLAGFLISLTSGAAFSAVLKQIALNWSGDRLKSMSSELKKVSLIVPFLGICTGICLFLSAGIEIFGFPGKLSYFIATPLTILIGLLVWRQLGSMLALAEKQGFQSIDIDS